MNENLESNQSFNNAVTSNTNTDDIVTKAKPARKSGIELLKIISMLLIVFSHVYCAVKGVSPHVSLEGYTDYIVDIESTTNISNIILRLVSSFGNLGNTIFFTCSAWFLLDKETSNKKRLLRLFADLFTVNVLWLIAMLCYKGYSTLGLKTCIRSFFPFYFQMNWYVVTYVLFALIAPLINRVIKTLTKEQHFVISLVLFIFYMVFSIVKSYPGYSALVLWISFYFVISYFKLYGTNFIDSTKANVIVLISSILLMIVLHLVINFAGMKISFLSGKIAISKNCNFILFFTAFSAFNLMRKTTFSSKFINYVASLTLVIYLIHDNTFMQGYIKPEQWHWIYNNWGYNHFLLIFFGYGLALFIASALIAALYNLTLQKLVHMLSDKIYGLLAKLINWCQTKLIKVIK